jgi:hypothetical protein
MSLSFALTDQGFATIEGATTIAITEGPKQAHAFARILHDLPLFPERSQWHRWAHGRADAD